MCQEKGGTEKQIALGNLFVVRLGRIVSLDFPHQLWELAGILKTQCIFFRVDSQLGCLSWPGVCPDSFHFNGLHVSFLLPQVEYKIPTYSCALGKLK